MECVYPGFHCQTASIKSLSWSVELLMKSDCMKKADDFLSFPFTHNRNSHGLWTCFDCKCSLCSCGHSNFHNLVHLVHRWHQWSCRDTKQLWIERGWGSDSEPKRRKHQIKWAVQLTEYSSSARISLLLNSVETGETADRGYSKCSEDWYSHNFLIRTMRMRESACSWTTEHNASPGLKHDATSST